MNKNHVLIISLIVIISFSAGVFTEILVPSGRFQLSTDLPAAGTAILDYLRSDALTMLASLIFSCTVVLMPAVALLAWERPFLWDFPPPISCPAARTKPSASCWLPCFPAACLRSPLTWL